MNTATFFVEDLRHLFGQDNTINFAEHWNCVGVSTDTRTVSANQLFIALSGERYDAHNHLTEAFEKGATAALVEYIPEQCPENVPLVLVPDSRRALGALAAFHRLRFSLPVIAVAGSAGKTTTKEMIASILVHTFGAEKVLKTSGNFNNQIGVPQTLLRLNDNHKVAVIEIGTNEPGEIEYLCSLVKPDYGIITTIGKEHLEKLRDLDGVEQEETALFRFLDQFGGTALVNLDDERLRRYAAEISSLFTFGTKRGADLMADISITNNGEPFITFVYKRGTKRAKASVVLRCVGTIMAFNALAAAAVSIALGVELPAICSALGRFSPAPSETGYGRMVVEKLHGLTILNDSYNANPVSMEAAITTLSQLPCTGKKILVLGDMRELGSESLSEHLKLLRRLDADKTFAKIIITGQEMLLALTKCLPELSSRTVYCSTVADCVAELQRYVTGTDCLLFKGSRGMRTEEIIAAFRLAYTAIEQG